jgi:hypothetical protein
MVNPVSHYRLDRRAAPYAYGSYASNACPTGFATIGSASQCQTASSALALAWANTVNSPTRPRGCHASSYDASFNADPSGGASSLHRLICYDARTPSPTSAGDTNPPTGSPTTRAPTSRSPTFSGASVSFETVAGAAFTWDCGPCESLATASPSLLDGTRRLFVAAGAALGTRPVVCAARSVRLAGRRRVRRAALLRRRRLR